MNIITSRCSGWSATLPLAEVRDEEWKLRAEIRNSFVIYDLFPHSQPWNVKVLVLEAILQKCERTCVESTWNVKVIDVVRSLMTSLFADLVLKSCYVTGVVPLQIEVMSAFTVIVQKNLIGPCWLYMLLPTCLNPLITFLTRVHFWDTRVTRHLPLLPKSQPLL